MEESKAKETLEGLFLDSTNEAYPFTEEFGEAVNVAIQALERQIPKKPTYEGNGYAPDGTFVWDEWLCPCCKSRYEADYDDYTYCPNCGQKIDWGMKNEAD